jgi:hypothetical protein
VGFGCSGTIYLESCGQMRLPRKFKVHPPEGHTHRVCGAAEQLFTT